MEVRRRDREGFEVLLRRFFREVQQSRILTEAKKYRYFTKETSREKKREAARRKAARKRVKQGW